MTVIEPNLKKLMTVRVKIFKKLLSCSFQILYTYVPSKHKIYFSDIFNNKQTGAKVLFYCKIYYFTLTISFNRIAP